MLLNLSEDQEFFRQTTDRFLTEQVPPDALRQLRGDPIGYDPAYWRRGAELGWTSLLVSEEHGGGTISDSGLEDAGLVAYEFGRHAAPGPLAVVNVVAATLSELHAAPDVLAGLLSGESVATWCAPPSVRRGGSRPSMSVATEPISSLTARPALWSRPARRPICW